MYLSLGGYICLSVRTNVHLCVLVCMCLSVCALCLIIYLSTNLSTNTATPPHGDYVQVSGVLQTGRQCSES